MFQALRREFAPPIRHFCLLSGFSALAASLVLAVVRIWQPTTLLFDQFLILTFLIFICLTLFLLRGNNLKKGYFFSSDRVTKILVAALISLLFFSTIQYSVLTVDRSRSLYLFAWVKKGVVESDKGVIRILDYSQDPSDLHNVDAIAQRIHEQTSRKLMSVHNNKVQLTFADNLLLKFSRVVAAIFNLKGWYSNT